MDTAVIKRASFGISDLVKRKFKQTRSLTTVTDTRRKGEVYSITTAVDALIPRYRFGTSVYTTPVLLLLRLFYGAASFTTSHPAATRLVSDSDTSAPEIDTMVNWLKTEQHAKSAVEQGLTQRANKLRVLEWEYSVRSDPSMFSWRLVSVTWVKALASNLTHEYLQFVIAHSETNTRHRLVADRNDDGDYIFVGHDWASATEPASCHDLPLPLLTLSFEHLERSAQPLLTDFASIIVNVSTSQPEYGALKYMCWWFAETILGSTLTRHGGRMIEWKSAHLRYSVVVRTGLIKRKELTRRAEAFRALNVSSMCY